MVRDRDKTETFDFQSGQDRDLPTFPRDQDETFENYVSRLSRDRDVETETTTLPLIPKGSVLQEM